jgi:hypothetical protein
VVFEVVFNVLIITPTRNIQMTWDQMRWKDNLITFNTVHIMLHEILYNDTVLHRNLDIKLTVDLLTSLHKITRLQSCKL